eukprot:3541075-Alexandrium_andersonii.AAC.1
MAHPWVPLPRSPNAKKQDGAYAPLDSPSVGGGGHQMGTLGHLRGTVPLQRHVRLAASLNKRA